MAEINALLDGWKDQAFADDDDFGEDGTVSDLFKLWDRIVKESLYG